VKKQYLTIIPSTQELKYSALLTNDLALALKNIRFIGSY